MSARGIGTLYSLLVDYLKAAKYALSIDPASAAASGELNSYLSHIYTIPSEILGNIFLSLKDINPPWVHYESATKKRKRLGFTQVRSMLSSF
jgi:hypothetical protein